MTKMAQVRVLAAARASLLRQGVTGLQSAPCLRALLLALPNLLQEQYQYEKPLVVSGEQLLHSGYLKCLAALVLVLRLDKVLCYQPVPPNHDEHLSVGKLYGYDNYNYSLLIIGVLFSGEGTTVCWHPFMDS
jgi:hypothetical protein